MPVKCAIQRFHCSTNLTNLNDRILNSIVDRFTFPNFRQVLYEHNYN